MLRERERHLLSTLADNSQSSAHNEVRMELRKVMGEMLADTAAIRKLGSAV